MAVINKSELFALVVADDPSWREIVNSLWNTTCLNEDDKRRIRVLSAGGGGGLTFVDVPADSDAAGSAGQVASDGDYFYYYDSSISKWRRTPATEF